MVRLLSGLWAIESVSTLGVAKSGPEVHVWVLMHTENLDAEATISALEREYRVEAVPEGATFELHVAPLDRVDPDMLPPFTPIFVR